MLWTFKFKLNFTEWFWIYSEVIFIESLWTSYWLDYFLVEFFNWKFEAFAEFPRTSSGLDSNLPRFFCSATISYNLAISWPISLRELNNWSSQTSRSWISSTWSHPGFLLTSTLCAYSLSIDVSAKQYLNILLSLVLSLLSSIILLMNRSATMSMSFL